MSNVITFRPRATVAHVPPAPSPAETRRMIEEAAQTALDTADSLLAILDRIDGDADVEDSGDGEPSLAVHESQVVWLRGGGADREAGAADLMLPVVAAEVAPLPWGGSGNVVAAAGMALLEMVARPALMHTALTLNAADTTKQRGASAYMPKLTAGA